MEKCGWIQLCTAPPLILKNAQSPSWALPVRLRWLIRYSIWAALSTTLNCCTCPRACLSEVIPAVGRIKTQTICLLVWVAHTEIMTRVLFITPSDLHLLLSCKVLQSPKSHDVKHLFPPDRKFEISEFPKTNQKRSRIYIYICIYEKSSSSFR